MFRVGLPTSRDIDGVHYRPALVVRFTIPTDAEIKQLDKDYADGADKRKKMLEEALERKAKRIVRNIGLWTENSPAWDWDDTIQQELYKKTGSDVTGKTLLSLDALDNDDGEVFIMGLA